MSFQIYQTTMIKTFIRVVQYIEHYKINKTIVIYKTTFDKLLNGIEGGEGTFGKLIKDDGLYNNLDDTLTQLEALLEDMKLHPKRYVHFSLFGKKDKPYTSRK